MPQQRPVTCFVIFFLQILYCSDLVLYTSCTGQILYCTDPVLDRSCTGQILYWTDPVLYIFCTVKILYCTHHVLNRSCTVQTMYESWARIFESALLPDDSHYQLKSLIWPKCPKLLQLNCPSVLQILCRVFKWLFTEWPVERLPILLVLPMYHFHKKQLSKTSVMKSLLFST